MKSLENSKNIQKYVKFVFYRDPKKNHETLLQLTNRLIELFKKEVVIYDCFSLNNAEEILGLINITKIIPINAEEEEI